MTPRKPVIGHNPSNDVWEGNCGRQMAECPREDLSITPIRELFGGLGGRFGALLVPFWLVIGVAMCIAQAQLNFFLRRSDKLVPSPKEVSMTPQRYSIPICTITPLTPPHPRCLSTMAMRVYCLLSKKCRGKKKQIAPPLIVNPRALTQIFPLLFLPSFFPPKPHVSREEKTKEDRYFFSFAYGTRR